MDYRIINGHIVNEGRVETREVCISNGLLVEHLDNNNATIIDASGCYVMPGVIDTHVHFREPGLTDKADMQSESLAAARGGVTSIIDMPNTLPQTTSLATLEEKEQMARDHCCVNYGFMLGATNDNIEQLLAVEPTRYAAIKLFLGSSTGNMLVNDEERLDTLFRQARKIIVAHCEEESIIQSNTAALRPRYEGTAGETAALHPQIRSKEACLASTKKAIERALRYGTRFHVAHITTAEETALLSSHATADKHITAEVSPNHLHFSSNDYTRLGNLIKCNPAIKDEETRQALLQALFDGRIDSIATDHAPHTLQSKQKPYFSAPSGIPSIQHSLQMVIDDTLPLFPTNRDAHFAFIAEKMCHNPATIFGLHKRGFLRNGYYADIVIVAPDESETVTNESLLYKCKWSPIEGATLHSRIRATFINGNLFDGTGNKAMPLEYER